MARGNPVARRQAREQYEHAAAEAKPGSGARFAALKNAAAKGGARNPAAVAAAAGRKKYGAKRMAEMAAAGRKKK